MLPVQFGSHTHSQLIPLNCKYLPPGGTHLGGSGAVSRASSRVFNPSCVLFKASKRLRNPSFVLFRASIRPANSVSLVLNPSFVLFKASKRLHNPSFVLFRASIRPANSVSLVLKSPAVELKSLAPSWSIRWERPTSPPKQYTSPSTRTFWLFKTISASVPTLSMYTSPFSFETVTLFKSLWCVTGFFGDVRQSSAEMRSSVRRTHRWACADVVERAKRTTRSPLVVILSRHGRGGV